MGFILFIHLASCILLIISILMQAGRGGGLNETFASAESMFGTQTNTLMVRFSTVVATIFFCTSLILAVNAAKGNKSLMAQTKVPVQAAQAPKAEEPTVQVSDPKPMNDAKPTEAAVLTNTAK